MRREFALQRTQRSARRLGRAAVDEVGHGFGLREVELVIEVGALRELAGCRHSSTKREHPLQQQLHDDGTAMAMEFEHVLARERMRCREEQGEALVDRVRVGIVEHVQFRVSRQGHVTEQLRRDLAHGRSRDTHDADAATAWRRRNRRDRYSHQAYRYACSGLCAAVSAARGPPVPSDRPPRPSLRHR